MEQSVTAIFDTYAAASQAVDRVRREGIADRDVSIMSNDTSMERSTYGDYRHDADSDAGTGAGTGATMGAVAGGAAGLMAGMGLLAIPGLGPVVAAGWLAATLV
ncbi:MAG: general stress protein, partial [Phreatobacter sp.]